MKVFWFSTLLAIVCFIAGGVLLGTSDFSQIKSMSYMKSFEFNFDEDDPKVTFNLKDMVGVRDYDLSSESMSFNADQVRAIDVSGITSSIEVIGDEDADQINLTIECLSEYQESCKNLVSTQERGVLHIALSNEPKLLQVRNLIKNIRFVLPKNSATQIKLKVGAGNIEIEDVLLSQVEIKLGAGDILIDETSIENLDIKNGAGTIKVTSLDIKKELKIKNGTGDIKVSTLRSDPTADIKNGTGNLEFKVDSLEKDFKLNVKAGMGSVTTPQSSRDGKGLRVFGNGKGLVSLKTGVGSITVE